jgi:hypothetical protein
MILKLDMKQFSERLRNTFAMHGAILLLAANQLPSLGETVSASPARTACANATELHDLIWSKDVIKRRKAQHELSLCGPDYWDLKKLMANLPTNRPELSFINLLGALDSFDNQSSVRFTKYLIKQAESPDPEIGRLGIVALGYLMQPPFGKIAFDLAQDTIGNAINNSDPEIRIAALKSLQSVINYHSNSGNGLPLKASTVASLQKSADDPVPAVRAEALLVLIQKSPYVVCGDGHLGGALILPLQAKWTLGNKHLTDPDPRVRTAALQLLCGIPRITLSRIQQEQLQRSILSQIEDPADIVAASALESMTTENALAQLASGSGSSHRISSLLRLVASRPNPPKLNQVTPFAKQLLGSKYFAIRINSQRLINAAASYENQSIDLDASAQLFLEGLRSSSPSEQIDAIQGLSELYPSPGRQSIINNKPLPVQAIIKMVEPSLNSPNTAVRWSAAVFIGNLNPNHTATLDVLNEILALGAVRGAGGDPLDLAKAWANAILAKSSLAQIQRAFSRQVPMFERQDLEHVYGRGPCVLPYIPGLYSESVSIIMSAYRQQEMRRLASETIIVSISDFQPDDLSQIFSELKRNSLTGPLDLRYDSIYTYGMILKVLRSTHSAALMNADINEALSLLKTFSAANDENPEVRRIASVMLSALGEDSVGKTFAAKQGTPQRRCPLSHNIRFEPNVEYDFYEDRCMYVAGGGCGAGLPQVFSSLRQLFGKDLK